MRCEEQAALSKGPVDYSFGIFRIGKAENKAETSPQDSKQRPVHFNIVPSPWTSDVHPHPNLPPHQWPSVMMGSKMYSEVGMLLFRLQHKWLFSQEGPVTSQH